MDGVLVSEIPDAFAVPVLSSLETPIEPIYDLPSDQWYDILLKGEGLNEPGSTDITQRGPGFATWVDNIAVGSTTQDHIEVAPDGTQLTYEPNGNQVVTLGMALDRVAVSHEFQIQNIQISAGLTGTLLADEDSGVLKFISGQSQTGAYDLEIIRVDDAGQQTFLFPLVPAQPGDTHFFHYGEWDGNGSITLDIDYNSDGSVDGVRPLRNGGPVEDDQDGDGYETMDSGGEDCNDSNPFISPDADEICDDGIDNNCNGDIDEGCVALIGDLNGDGCVDRSDYNILIADVRGSEPHNMEYDLNGDEVVNISDARYLVTQFTNPRGAACQ
jgi:hypothetical protein